MRVGVLTGGGDCPGLTPLSAPWCARESRSTGWSSWVPRRLAGTARGGHGAARRRRGARDPAARRHDPRLVADQPVQGERSRPQRRRADQGQPHRPRRGRAHRHRRRGHPRRGRAAERRGHPRRRGAQDDRQRPRGDRLHVRLRHRGEHRHGGDRPPAHDGRKPSPGADRRGDGPPRGLDRAARGPGRRRQRDPHPGAPVRHREGLRLRGAPVPDPVRADRGGRRGRPPDPGRALPDSGELDAFGHVRLGGVG